MWSKTITKTLKNMLTNVGDIGTRMTRKIVKRSTFLANIFFSIRKF